MNKCTQCNVFIDENLQKCPLCHRSSGSEKAGLENIWYPAYDMAKTDIPRSSPSNVALFLSITAISICLLINLLTGIENPWFLFVLGPVLYTLLLIYNTILSKTHVGAKILLQLISISSVLFIIDFFSGFYRWSVNVVIPFLIITGSFLITIIICIKKMLWSEYIGYVIAMIFLGFMPLLLYFIGVSSIIWASASAALFSSLTTVGLLIFSKKKFKNELIRRFHF